MWKTTGEPRWREYGWKIFQAIEREARSDAGYAALVSVEFVKGARKDEMPRCVRSMGTLSASLTARPLAPPVTFLPKRECLIASRRARIQLGRGATLPIHNSLTGAPDPLALPAG